MNISEDQVIAFGARPTAPERPSNRLGAVKHDTSKPRVELLSRPALEGCSRVLEFGANKYAADNWRKGMEWRRVIGALIRHALEFSDGKDIDEESGLPVIDHVMCCAMFLSEFQKRNLGVDDRHKPEGDR